MTSAKFSLKYLNYFMKVYLMSLEAHHTKQVPKFKKFITGTDYRVSALYQQSAGLLTATWIAMNIARWSENWTQTVLVTAGYLATRPRRHRKESKPICHCGKKTFPNYSFYVNPLVTHFPRRSYLVGTRDRRGVRATFFLPYFHIQKCSEFLAPYTPPKLH